MPWESAVIGLFVDAIKSLFGRFGDSLNEQRAAELVSQAMRELLMVNPQIEKVRASIMEAEKLLKTPSAELLRVQVLLDRVLGNQDSAHRALYRMCQAYQMEGNRRGEAEAHLLSGITDLEFGNYHEATKSFQQAVCIFQQIGDEISLAKALMYTIDVAIHEGRFDQAREALSSVLKISRRYPSQINNATVLIELGDLAVSYDQKNLALRFFVTSLVIQDDEHVRQHIQELSKRLCLSEDQLQKFIEEMKASYAQHNEDEFAETIFRES